MVVEGRQWEKFQNSISLRDNRFLISKSEKMMCAQLEMRIY